ncbi:nuclear transport factor 2 family protein [Leptospira ilyithenensis]|uniref:Polyketide cyclase n=1 Tax=Leptospira ilyithenensis TaxID=2484901 RepID=A0A4V3JX03_9LEPT|nr:polyketide cyclase [Leptospira ilyithenensis]TGN10111.1 polyketide cyclase [Leptospira ilyithenensis]
MTIQESNKKIVKEYFDLISEQKLSEAFVLLADDLHWWILGNIPVSGDYDKRKISLGFKMLQRNFEKFTFLLGEMTAEEDRVSLIAESKAIRKSNSKLYNNHYHFLITLNDNQIVKVKEYFDTVHAVWVEES